MKIESSGLIPEDTVPTSDITPFTTYALLSIYIVLSYASSTLPNIYFATECPSTQTFSLFVSFDDSIKLPAAIVRLLILT